MSTAELIEAIEALPPEKQREVESFVRRLSDNGQDSGKVSLADNSKVQEAATRIFNENAELFQKLAR